MSLSWEGALILLPAACSVVLFIAPRLARPVAAAAAGGVPLLTAGVIGELFARGAWRHAVGGWGAPLGIDLQVDGLSALMLGMTSLVVPVATLYALGYFRDGEGGMFWPLWFFLWGALNALFLSGDAFNLYVTLELVAFSAVALVALEGTAVALAAAMRYLLASLAASLCYMLGVALLYGDLGLVDLRGVGEALAGGGGGASSRVALALMSAGLLLKTALFPLHFWLPPAHASAPAPVSAVLSALVVKTSLYLLLRLWFEVFAPSHPPSVLLGVLGAGAILWGSLQALRQERLKLLVAYSTVAQLGYIFLLFPLVAAGGVAAWGGGVLFAFSHACGKAAMFLAAGTILHAAGHDRIGEFGGLPPALLPSVATFGISGANLIGLPPSGGFAAKWMLLNAAFAAGAWWWVLVILAGTLLSAGYVFRVLAPVFRGGGAAPLLHPPSPLQQWSAFALALFALLLGLVAGAPLTLATIGAPVGGPFLHGAP